MKFSTFTSVLASATLALANTVTFLSLDSVERTIIFTPNAGLEWLPSVVVPGGATVKVSFPHAWIGNWYSVSKGKTNTPGMLGEVTFQGWNGFTYFDVSAIVNPNDHDGVKEMYPSSASRPTSGCKYFPCNNAYYLPDDVQTKTTTEVDLVCTLGSGGEAKREAEVEEASENVARNFVLGKWDA